MSTVLTIVLLGLLGIAIGLLLAWLTKLGHSRQTEEKPASAEAARQLAQLKSQLDSGLITKEEYKEKRQEIL